MWRRSQFSVTCALLQPACIDWRSTRKASFVSVRGQTQFFGTIFDYFTGFRVLFGNHYGHP